MFPHDVSPLEMSAVFTLLTLAPSSLDGLTLFSTPTLDFEDDDEEIPAGFGPSDV